MRVKVYYICAVLLVLSLSTPAVFAQDQEGLDGGYLIPSKRKQATGERLSSKVPKLRRDNWLLKPGNGHMPLSTRSRYHGIDIGDLGQFGRLRQDEWLCTHAG